MTMGHIIVQTDNGRQIVVPNSLAVSQVVIKLTA